MKKYYKTQADKFAWLLEQITQNVTLPFLKDISCKKKAFETHKTQQQDHVLQIHQTSYTERKK